MAACPTPITTDSGIPAQIVELSLTAEKVCKDTAEKRASAQRDLKNKRKNLEAAIKNKRLSGMELVVAQSEYLESYMDILVGDNEKKLHKAIFSVETNFFDWIIAGGKNARKPSQKAIKDYGTWQDAQNLQETSESPDFDQYLFERASAEIKQRLAAEKKAFDAAQTDFERMTRESEKMLHRHSPPTSITDEKK